MSSCTSVSCQFFVRIGHPCFGEYFDRSSFACSRLYHRLFLAMRQCPHCNYLYFWQMNTSASHRPLLLFFLPSKYWFYSREERSVNVPSAQTPRFCRWLLFCTREDICSGTPQRHSRVVYCLLTSTLSFSTRAEDGRNAKKEHTKDTIQTNKTYENVDDRLKRTIARFSSNPWSSIVVLVQKRMVPCAFASIIGRRIK